jgi:Ca2+-transporting ATPase
MKLSISEAMLTGESLPINKNIDDMISMGTVVLSGSGYMRVATIGAQTQLGKIATEVQTPNELTPLQKQLEYFSKQLTWIVLGIVIVVVIVGFVRHMPWVEIFTTAVALAVGAIPE